MQVTILCFGHLSDFVGSEPFLLELSEGATVADLARALEARDPRFAGVERRCRFAVDEEYTDLKQVLSEGNTVAVLPPMSGG